MTKRLFFENSYLDTFTAVVESREGTTVVLDQTAFYPTGGGQPHDVGWIRYDGKEYDVIDVTGRDTISHQLAMTPAFETGVTVTGVLDWERRFSLMQYHTAQHLVSAVLLDHFGAATTGNQLYPTRARIDCAYERFDEDDFEVIENIVNEYITVDHPVSTRVLDRKTAEATLDPERTRLDLLPDSVTEVRIVTIGDPDDPIDQTACAGTHVKSTIEIPPMEITGRETKGSAEERIEFSLAGAGEPPA